MKTRYLGLFAFLLFITITRGQDIDKELALLAEKLAVPVKEHGTKKITVLDFTDLHGGESELGKYIAEQLTVDFVLTKRDFTVLDRANLAKILAEHKLTAKGLVDPENAKKLGQFAGVDALVLGTIIPKGQSINLTAKIITTDTAEVVGAARADFKLDETVKEMLAKKVESGSGGGDAPETPNIVKTFGTLRVELSALEIVEGKRFVLTMTLSNTAPAGSVWVTLDQESANVLSLIRDPKGSEFKTYWQSISGFAEHSGSFRGILTEIKAKGSIVTTLRFSNEQGKIPSPGKCVLRMELIVANEKLERPEHYPIQIVKAELEGK